MVSFITLWVRNLNQIVLEKINVESKFFLFIDTLETETLRFSNPYYTGSIVNGSLSLGNINLVEGYAPDVNFTVAGGMCYLQ